MSTKKFVAVASFAFAMAFAAVASAATWDFGTATVQVGSKGMYASNVQTALNACFNAGLTVDGNFGNLSATAAKNFQASKGLMADGKVGPATKAALNNCGSLATNPAPCPAGYVCQPAGGSNTGSNSGSLSGGAGSIDTIDQISSSVEEEVIEGDEEVKVLGFDLTAEGSDLDITSIRVSFENTNGSGSDRFDRYADRVSVWYEGEEVGAEDADDFSESNDIYSKSIALDGAIVKEDEDGRFYVAIDAASSIDSADFAADWTVTVEQIRYEDATGAILTESPSSVDEVFNFEDLASSGDLEFNVKKTSDSPDAQTVEVESNGETDVLMLELEVKAEGSDMTVDSLDFDVTSTGNDIEDIANEFTLSIDGDEIDSINGSTLSGTSDTLTFTDLEDELSLDDGDTVTLQVWARVNEIDGSSFANGDSLEVSMTTANRNAADVEDENGDSIQNADRKGSALGEEQTFMEDGIMVAFVSDSAAVSGQDADTGTFTIKFKVTAFGDTVYISSDATESIASAVQGPGSATTSAQIRNTTDADVTGSGNFDIEDGDTESFTVTISATNVSVGGLYNAVINAINFNTTDSGSVYGDSYSSNLDEFQTDAITINQ